MSVTSNDYVNLLMGEYIRRKRGNNYYSERAFARSLGLSPGFLTLLFQGKKNLSLARAHEICGRINWSESKKALFLNHVQNSAALKSRQIRGKTILKPEQFFEICDWFHFAMLEFIKVKKGICTAIEISQCLNISKTETTFALKNLMLAGLIRKTEHGYHVPDRYEIPSISSAGIRKYHAQNLKLAESAIENQNFDGRDFRGLTLAFDSKKMLEAKKFIEKFVSDFDRKFGASAPNSVYHLNTSLFRLDRENQS